MSLPNIIVLARSISDFPISVESPSFLLNSMIFLITLTRADNIQFSCGVPDKSRQLLSWVTRRSTVARILRKSAKNAVGEMEVFWVYLTK